MSKQPISDSSFFADCWAEVRARNQVVRYRRSGAGRAVLLLHGPGDADAIWPELMDVLHTGFRLIVPTPPPADVALEPWLAVLLDGLGMSNVAVIATDAFSSAAVDRALAEPDQIAAVVLVSRDEDSPSTATRFAVPLLVLRRDQPAHEIMPLVLGLLAPDSAARRA
jgi:hypothetical protein